MKGHRIRFMAGALALASVVGTTPIVSVAYAANNKVEIDQELLTRLEGFKLNGYVPNQGTSGVTIATGFDIGGQSASALRSSGLPAALIAKILPYAGLKRADAVAALAKKPLTVTTAEATALNKLAQATVLAKVIRDFNAKSKVRFQDLPSEAQSVIYIVAYQYYDLPGRTPNFFKLITTGRWAEAVKELQNFGAADERRNDTLAAYLNRAIQSGELSAGPGGPAPATPPTVTPTIPTAPATGTPSTGTPTTPGTPTTGTPPTTTPPTTTPPTTTPATPGTPTNLDFLDCEEETPAT